MRTMWTLSVPIMLALCFFGTGDYPAAAQQARGKNAGATIGEPHSFRLTYREDGFDMRHWINEAESEVEFKRLPAIKDRYPVTKLISSLEMGLLWDREGRKLYLDANRNGDLTDDPAYDGVMGDGDVQEFRGIRVKKGACPFTIGFIGRPQGAGRLEMHIQSAWQGEIELAGVRRALAVLAGPEQVSGGIGQVYLGLVPDADGKTELPVNSEPLIVENARRLFFDGHDYSASYVLDESTSPPAMVATFQEVECKTATKSLRGPDLLRVQMLSQGRGVVIIDKPRGDVVAPDDRFQMVAATLWRADDPEICLVGRTYRGSDNMRSDNVTFGEGLSQSLETYRYGTRIYTRLVWKDRAGQTYAALAVTPGKTAPRPKIAIRLGDKDPFDGHLEYG